MIRIHNKKHFVHVLKSECNLKNVIWQISHINRIKLFFDNRSANINGTQRTGLSRAKYIILLVKMIYEKILKRFCIWINNFTVITLDVHPLYYIQSSCHQSVSWLSIFSWLLTSTEPLLLPRRLQLVNERKNSHVHPSHKYIIITIEKERVFHEKENIFWSSASR